VTRLGRRRFVSSMQRRLLESGVPIAFEQAGSIWTRPTSVSARRNLALRRPSGQAFPMSQRCEVCESMRPEPGAPVARELRTVSFGDEPITLCSGHARIAENAGVASFQALCELYGSGRRSFVPRRRSTSSSACTERRISDGRRASDARG
jgi:hypothetical protein